MRVSKKYIDLIEIFPLRPIKSDRDLDAAQDVLDSLIDKGAKRSADENDYMDVLSDLMQAYEDATHPVESLPPHQMLAESIKAREVSLRQVAAETGIAHTTLSDLIHQKRGFTLAHVEKLCAYFGYAPGVFIQVPEQAGTKK